MSVIRAILLLILLPFCAGAQKFFTTHYRVADGLPSEQVRAVQQGKYGFMWIATDGGLLRFDGQHFTGYKRALDSRYIKALIQGPDGLLLANDTGVYTIHEKPDTAQARRLIPGLPVETDSTLLYPNGLHLSQEGALWASQPNGKLARWENGKLDFFDFGKDHTTGDSHSGFTFGESPQGALFVAATTGQLYHFSRENGRFARISLSIPMDTIYCMYTRGDILWIGGDGLFRARMEGEKLIDGRFFPMEGKLARSLAPAGQSGWLFVGTVQQGLYRAQLSQGRLLLQEVFGYNDPHRINQLPFRSIHQVYPDEKGNIWLSTGQGLGLLQSRFFQTVFGLANNNTFIILPRENGEVLLSFGDVYKIGRNGRDFYAELLPGLDQGFVTGLTERDGQLWMSTADAELLTYQNGRPRLAADLSERGGGIFFIHADRQQNVWFCQAPNESPIVGVGKLQPNGKIRYYEEEEGLGNRILVVRESERGRIYAAGIGPDSYLYRYLPDDDAFLNLSLPLTFNYSQAFEVHDMAIDEQGIVWLATTDGLLRYDLERVQRINLGPFTNTEIRSLAAMEGGALWLATDTEGLIHYQDGKFTVFEEHTGLPSKIAAYRCLALSPSGRLWMGTAEGAVYSRDLLPAPDTTEAPVLQGIAVNDRPVALAPAIEAPNNSTVFLAWATPSFPGRNLEYRYRLLGSPDSNWISLGPEARLRLKRMPFGDYRLEASGRQKGGHEWSPPLALGIEVHRPWYRRWWAILIFIGIGGLLLYYLFQLNIGRLLRRIQVLEHDLAAREKEIERQENLLREQSQAIAVQARGLEEAEEELSQQQAEISDATSNLSLLHQLIRKLPRNSRWEQVVEALAETLQHSIGIDAFEFGWNDGPYIRFRGYVKRSKSYTRRREEFNEKSSLPVWVLVQKQAVLITDFSTQQQEYVEPSEDHQYQSAIFIPLEVAGRQLLVLCAYAYRKNAFDELDQQMLQILADYLSVAVKDRMNGV